MTGILALYLVKIGRGAADRGWQPLNLLPQPLKSKSSGLQGVSGLSGLVPILVALIFFLRTLGGRGVSSAVSSLCLMREIPE